MQRLALHRWLAFAAALVIGLLALWPLRLAPGLARTGLAAASATGSIWLGDLASARWRGLALGDLRVGLSPLALLTGRTRLTMNGTALRGTIEQGSTSGGATLSGDIPLAGNTPLPITQLILDGFNVRFDHGTCKTAFGKLRIMAAGPLAAASSGGSFSGTPKCEAGKLLLPLASGPARMDIRIGEGGGYRASMAVAGPDPANRAALLAAGFQPDPQGVVLNLEGSL
jgi:general secretion pathway protein N